MGSIQYITRWTAARKEALLASLKAGELAPEDALQSYGVSDEELQAWRRAHARGGRAGLRATYFQDRSNGGARR